MSLLSQGARPTQRLVLAPRRECSLLESFTFHGQFSSDELGSRGDPDWSRCAIDSVNMRALKGGT
jgi:hypothetical protein